MVINSFPSERMLVLRERAAGTYYASAYFMAKITSDTAVQLPVPVIFSAIVYFMIGLQPSAAHFFVFAGFMVLCNLAGGGGGCMRQGPLPAVQALLQLQKQACNSLVDHCNPAACLD